MKTSIISLFSVLLVVLLYSSCFSQQKEFKSSCEIRISSGQSFIDFYEGFGTGYSTGLTIKPEITYDFSRYFSSSFSLLFTTVQNGDKNANYNRLTSTENLGVSVFNQFQTTLAPEIQFSPIKTKKHNLYIGIGPTYTFGNSLLSQSSNELSTTMAKSTNEIGYQGTLGYKFSIYKSWTIGANYIYNKNVERTEHILLSLGFKIN